MKGLLYLVYRIEFSFFPLDFFLTVLRFVFVLLFILLNCCPSFHNLSSYHQVLSSALSPNRYCQMVSYFIRSFVRLFVCLFVRLVIDYFAREHFLFWRCSTGLFLSSYFRLSPDDCDCVSGRMLWICCLVWVRGGGWFSLSLGLCFQCSV